MTMKKSWWKILAVVVAVVVAGVGGYFLGTNAVSAQQKEEQELNVKLRHSELDGLDEIEDKIYVTGHKSPDSDTIGSSIGYASLLQKLGYDAEPVTLGKVNSETQYLLDTAGMEAPTMLEDASGCNIALVDHSEYLQSADGLEDANIISIVDHHGVGTVTSGKRLIYDARPLGATATIIWLRYRDYGLEPDKQVALVMLGSILSDTSNLTSGTTTFADQEAVKALGSLAGIQDLEAFYHDMYMASIAYTGMTDEEIFFSDYKEYDAGNKKYAIGTINAYDEEGAKDLADRMKKVVPSTLASTGMDMAFAQINIRHDDLDITYIVPSSDVAAEVLTSALGDKVVFDGTYYVANPGVGRKTVLVPTITDVLSAYPKE